MRDQPPNRTGLCLRPVFGTGDLVDDDASAHGIRPFLIASGWQIRFQLALSGARPTFAGFRKYGPRHSLGAGRVSPGRRLGPERNSGLPHRRHRRCHRRSRWSRSCSPDRRHTTELPPPAVLAPPVTKVKARIDRPIIRLWRRLQPTTCRSGLQVLITDRSRHLFLPAYPTGISTPRGVQQMSNIRDCSSMDKRRQRRC